MNCNYTTIIYSGQGTWDISLNLCEKMIEAQVDPKTIKRSPNLVADLNESVNLLVIPGGDAVKMLFRFDESAKKIKKFINNGGKVLGICAGGIVLTKNHLQCIRAKASTSNEKVRNIIISGKAYTTPAVLPHDLYPGTAFSPHIIVNKDKATDPSNICAAAVTMPDESSSPFSIYSYSGPAFIANPPQAKVLLRYQTPIDLTQVKLDSENNWILTGQKIKEINPAAIISYPIGKGKIVLSGVHFEMDPKLYSAVCSQSKQTSNYGKLPEELARADNEAKRQKIVEICFKELDIK